MTLERVGRSAIRLHPSLRITDASSSTLLRWLGLGVLVNVVARIVVG